MKSCIISLSEKGLNLDTFSAESKYINSKIYAYKNKNIVYAIEDSIIQYNLEQNKETYKYKLDKVKQIKLCNCGLHICVLTFDKILYYLFDGKVKILENNVDNADITCTHIVFVKNIKITIKKIMECRYSDTISDENNIEQKNDEFVSNNIKDFVLSGNLVFFSTRKTTECKQKIICYDPATEKTKNFDFDNIEKFTVKNDSENKYFLISVTIEYSKESYFGFMKLYFFDKHTLKELTIQQPLLYFNFIDNGFILCYGPQPSKVVAMNYLLEQKKAFPTGIRNAAYLNNHGNLIGFTGFGNLSGEVEIYSTKLLSKIKVLGASVFNWSPCGSYFLIGTTNELKVDNKIAIYDYYGRIIKEQHFDNLESCIWIGSKTTFDKLTEPQSLNVIEEIAYVPPHLRNKTKSHKDTKKTNENTKKRESNKSKDKIKTKVQCKEEEVNIEELQLKIDEINVLKNKIKDGEVLSVEDYNKILSESEILVKIQNTTKK